MSNELIKPPTAPLAIPGTEQTGESNFNVTNQAGGFLTINYQLPPKTTSSSAEQMMAIMSFSREYYQLIVTMEEDVFSTGTVAVSTGSALLKKHVPEEIYERCSSLTEAGIAELKKIPAIICKENTDYHGNTDPEQKAIYAYIKKIRKEKSVIKVVFEPIRAFSQYKLCEKRSAVFFDLNMECALTDLNQTGWSVHKANLFEAFDEAGLTDMPRPY